MDELNETLDLANDVDQSFCKIFSSDRDLRQVIVDIEKHSDCRSKAQDWARNLRFLLMIQLKDNKDLFSNKLNQGIMSTTTCPCRNVLEFRDQLNLAHRAAYIAVSYCWDRLNREWFSNFSEEPMKIIEAGISKKTSTVPPDVLHRSVAYAKHRDINWQSGLTKNVLIKMMRLRKKPAFKLGYFLSRISSPYFYSSILLWIIGWTRCFQLVFR